MLEDPTISMLWRGLDVAAFRQELLAHNIANADTPGYRRVDLSFAAFLDKAEEDLPMARTNPAHLANPQGTPAIQVARTDGPARTDGNTVVIEAEMARLSQNAMYYQALAAQLAKHFALLNTAISGR